MTYDRNGRERVVITAFGAISPLGIDTETTWTEIRDGKSGIRDLTLIDKDQFKVKVAAECVDFDPKNYFDFKEARRMDRGTQMGVAAAREAWSNSGATTETFEPYRIGTVIGTGVGGIGTMQTEVEKLVKRGARGVSPLYIPMMITNMIPGQISMDLQIKGTNYAVSSACASGTHAIGEAFHQIRDGYLDACLTGGVEAPITGSAAAGFANMTALSLAEDPAQASRPFDLNRDGFVMAEGAVILLLESLTSARARGAEIIAEVVGYGATADAYHITSPSPDGEGAAAAMKIALKDAGLNPEDVDYINAHGTSTPLNDSFETAAIKLAMGEENAHNVSISSTKGATGHLLGAAGAIEALVCAFALREGIVPPTLGLTTPDPACDLDYTPLQAKTRSLKVALSNSLGFGGHNATLAFRRYDEESR